MCFNKTDVLYIGKSNIVILWQLLWECWFPFCLWVLLFRLVIMQTSLMLPFKKYASTVQKKKHLCSKRFWSFYFSDTMAKVYSCFAFKLKSKAIKLFYNNVHFEIMNLWSLSVASLDCSPSPLRTRHLLGNFAELCQHPDSQREQCQRSRLVSRCDWSWHIQQQGADTECNLKSTTIIEFNYQVSHKTNVPYILPVHKPLL